MTPETREALKEFALAVSLLSMHQVHNGVNFAAERLIRALEQEATRPCGECGGSGVVDSGGVTPWGMGIDIPCPSCELARKRAIASDYETWRDEQLDTLRKLFRQRGFSDGYKSFPDFCLEQYEGSDKGKVKI